VSNWSDTEVRVDGFTGRYAPMGPNFFNLGDRAEVWIWNAQNGAGPATYELTVGRGAGAANAGKPNGSAPPRDGQDVKTGIHSVDFRNFEYRPNCLKETVRVSNGEWKEVKENEENYFRIVRNYGDLKGDGQDQAVGLGACGGVANIEIDDVIIFSTSPGGPTLVAELSPPDWGKGEKDNGGISRSLIRTGLLRSTLISTRKRATRRTPAVSFRTQRNRESA
jgi:hypothetical protein